MKSKAAQHTANAAKPRLRVPIIITSASADPPLEDAATHRNEGMRETYPNARTLFS